MFHPGEAAIDDAEPERLLAAWRERIGRGERVDPAEAEHADPRHAARLREGLATLQRLERAFGAGTGPRAEDSLVGTAVGPWRVTALLGSGGMGAVYLAQEGARRVALKLLHPHLLARAGFLERFRREAEVGRRIRHENVVATIDVGSAEVGGAPRHYLAMEYVEGQTLRAMLAELGRLPEDLCRHVGREVAQGLAAIHAAGVVHRDLKPDNVIVTSDHVVKVMDLGVALLVDETARLSQTGAFVGSIHYAAPEQFRRGGRELDARADLHALGLVLYELATGTHPYPHDDFHEVLRRLLTEKPRRAAEINSQLAPFFEELLAQLLQKDPDRRFASADEVARVLGEGEESAWWHDRARALRIETRRPLRRNRIPRETALYGREAELAKLRALFDKAKTGEGQVLLVEGEAGIGKSRLVDEFVASLQREGEDLNFLFGSYPPGGAATVSGAFSAAYREHFGEESLEDVLPGYLTTTPLLVPAFAALLRGDATPRGAESLTKDSLQTVFVHATRALAAERPTIVLIEDLHFAPEEGRALFASLALAVPGHRVLLVSATRPGLPEKWIAQLVRQPQTTQLALPRLGAKELVHLLRDALKSERLAEELSALIAVKSDGNPFFVFEMLRGLKEGQFLEQRPDGTWHTTQVIRDIQVPSSILDLVKARVADLASVERDLLDVASCWGFEFDPALVAAAAGHGRIPTLKALAQIERAHRLVRSSGRRFVFDHHQVQEALYGSLPEGLREDYHAAVAAALEAQHGAAAKEPTDIDGAVCVDLAEQFLKGAQGARALRYLDAALTHLETHYLNDDAVRLAERALAEPGLLVGSARGTTLVRLAGRLDFLGRSDRQRAAIEEALASAREAGDRHTEAQATRDLGGVFWSLGRYVEAREHHERHLALAREIGDRQGEARATGNLGKVLQSLGRFAEAREHHEGCLAVAREIGYRQGEAMATGNLGIVFHSLGRYAEARESFEQWLGLTREIGDRRGEARATGNLGTVFWSLGRYAEARERWERWVALAREIGDRRGETAATGNLGAGFWALGHYAEALEQSERHLALAREIGDKPSETRATGNLGNVLRSLGRLADAREHLERALALAREIGDRPQEASALAYLADAVSESEDAHLAEHLHTESLDLRRSIGARFEEAGSLLARGALRARAGRNDEARADLEAALASARELSLPDFELAASAHLLTLPGGDVTVALAALVAHMDRVSASFLMESRFVLWRATHDPAHLREAERLLDHLVAYAPPDCRESMLANVRLHREIAEAAARELA